MFPNNSTIGNPKTLLGCCQVILYVTYDEEIDSKNSVYTKEHIYSFICSSLSLSCMNLGIVLNNSY